MAGIQLLCDQSSHNISIGIVCPKPRGKVQTLASKHLSAHSHSLSLCWLWIWNSICHGLNVVSPPNSHVQTLPPNVMALRKLGLWDIIWIRWGHENGALMNWIRVFIGVLRELAMGAHEKPAACTPEEGPHQTPPGWLPELRLPASRMDGNKFLLFYKPSCLWYLVVAARIV